VQTRATGKKKSGKKLPVMTPDTKCSFCTNTTCCTYYTQEIETPRSMEDFDTLLWQLSHEQTQTYKEEGSWYLLVYNRCRHVLKDGRCGIYDKRPQICREHSNDDCEFNTLSDASDFDLLFESYEQLDVYCRKRFKTWDKRFERWAKEG
jgi:Fe-S-cluster containining protein